MTTGPWTLTRIDRLTGRTLSQRKFKSIKEMMAELRRAGIPLTDEHAAEIVAHPDTQFDRVELVNDVDAAYYARVQYDMRPTASTEQTTPPPRHETMACRRCRAVGYRGANPFSTAPDTGYCDDCL